MLCWTSRVTLVLRSSCHILQTLCRVIFYEFIPEIWVVAPTASDSGTYYAFMSSLWKFLIIIYRWMNITHCWYRPSVVYAIHQDFTLVSPIYGPRLLRCHLPISLQDFSHFYSHLLTTILLYQSLPKKSIFYKCTYYLQLKLVLIVFTAYVILSRPRI